MIRLLPFAMGIVFSYVGLTLGGFFGWILMIIMAVLLLLLDEEMRELSQLNPRCKR